MANTGNTQQQINYGATANDGLGDPLRTAFIKTDENFDNIWLAGPVGSNITISNNTVQVNNTNGNLILKPNGVGIVQSNASILPNTTNTRDLGSANQKWRSAAIGTGGLTVDGNVTVTGNLTAGNISYTGNVFVGDLQGSVYADDSTIMVDAIDNAMFADSATFARANVTGNVTANYFVGNGSLLTGIASTYGNANVADYLPVYSGNLSAGNVSVTGNITANNQILQRGLVINNAGNVWDFDDATDTLRFPSGASWASLADGDDFINSAVDGYLTFTTYDASINEAVQLKLYHGFAQISIQNGLNLDWTFDNAGNLTVAKDILPSANNVGNLGAPSLQWNSLYVANNTIYIGGVALGVTGNTLTVAGEPVLSNDSGATITTTGNITANIITATESADLGSLNFYASVISMNDDVWDNIFISPNGESYAYLSVPKDSVANVQDVRLHNDAGNVEIGTGGGTYNWLFDNTGNLNLPNNGDINFASGGIVQSPDEDFTIRVQDADDDGFAVQQQVDDGAGNVLGSTELQRDLFTIAFAGGSAPQFRFNEAGQTEIPGNIRATEYVDTSLYSVSNDDGAGTVELKVISYAADTLGSNIRVAQSNATISTGNAQYTWLFDNTGVLTTPGDITGPGSLEIQAAPGGNAYVNLDDISDSYIGAAANLSLLTDSDNREWIFDTSGTLTTPGDITVGGDVTGRASANTLVIKAQPNTDTYIQLNSIVDSTIQTFANLDIVTDSSNTAQTFAFGTDGSLSVPGNITTGNILTDGYYYANGDPFVSSDYGDSNVVTLLSSFGSNTISTTGNVTAQNFVGNISITGNVTGTSANVELVAGSYTWTFDNTGNTAFANGTISANDITLTGNISATVDGYNIGYREIPQVALSANANAALADSGKHFYSTTAGNLSILIPTNANVAFPTGTAFTVVVQAAGNVLVNADTGVTLYMAGSSSAGNRTVGAYGMATVMKVATDTWFINGTGVY